MPLTKARTIRLKNIPSSSEAAAAEIPRHKPEISRTPNSNSNHGNVRAASSTAHKGRI
jgi:hypothetical protein